MSSSVNYLVEFSGLKWYKQCRRRHLPMTEIGGTAEPSPQKDVSGLIARRLDELAQLRGSEQAVATQMATGRPLPAAVVLLRRLGKIEQEDAAAGLDHRSRGEFAILRYVCG